MHDRREHLRAMLYLAGLIAGCAPAGSEKGKSAYINNCVDETTENTGCDRVRANMPFDVTYYTDENGIYHFEYTTWNSADLVVHEDLNRPIGNANLSVRYTPGSEALTINTVEIFGGITDDQMRAVLQKEIVGHAKTYNYIFKNHSGLINSENVGLVVSFADALSHYVLTSAEQNLVAGSDRNVPEWDGVDSPSPDVLLEVFRRGIQEGLDYSEILEVIGR